eukprot:GHVL01006640.1.p1 GENE.GHVL01006640.1~~GHVL01006640.1.p1  ORF type:complete len:169 (+),score=21.48 GHVL01006640.1:168-674(+)
MCIYMNINMYLFAIYFKLTIYDQFNSEVERQKNFVKTMDFEFRNEEDISRSFRHQFIMERAEGVIPWSTESDMVHIRHLMFLGFLGSEWWTRNLSADRSNHEYFLKDNAVETLLGAAGHTQNLMYYDLTQPAMLNVARFHSSRAQEDMILELIIAEPRTLLDMVNLKE